MTGPPLTAAAAAQLALFGEALACADEVAVFLWDDDRNYVAANDYACRLVGLTRDELLGRPVGFATADNARAEVELTQRRPLTTGASSFTNADGNEVRLEWVTFKTHVAGLPYMASICWQPR